MIFLFKIKNTNKEKTMKDEMNQKRKKKNPRREAEQTEP